MIHVTVAVPLGLDSLFFSFMEMLAAQNGHHFVNPPAEQLDTEKPGHWIEHLARSREHHFVVGYRYPPSYWPRLFEHATTVVVLADGDGIVRQIERIQMEEQEKGEDKEINQCFQEIRHAVNAMVEAIEWLLSEHRPSRLLIPAAAFHMDSGKAFQRLERFYALGGVPISTTCYQVFRAEALPALREIQRPSIAVKHAIHRLLSLEDVTATRLNALKALFGE